MRLTSLHTYPIKGCRGLDHDGAEVEPWGLRGDRRWMVVDGGGEAITQREEPALTGVRPEPLAGGGLTLRAEGRLDLAVPEPAGEPVGVTVFGEPVLATDAGDGARRWFSDLLGRDARLVWLDDPTRRPVYRSKVSPERVSLADGFPVSLASTASLEALNGWLAEESTEPAPLPITRFRPNLVISGAEAWKEDGWTGRRLRIGTVVFQVPEPIARCVVTTIDQDTGERGKEPLHTLGQRRNIDRKLLFATNLVPEGPGRIAVGDPVVAL